MPSSAKQARSAGAAIRLGILWLRRHEAASRLPTADEMLAKVRVVGSNIKRLLDNNAK
jgi:hypothetical protein